MAILYLLNPGAGLIELLSDFVPVVGNLDEATAPVILTNVLAWYGFQPGYRGSTLDRSRRNLLTKLLVPLAGALAALYLLNPGAGLIELIPDAFPLVGNLDEAAAMLLLTNVLAWYGIDLNRPGRRMGRKGDGSRKSSALPKQNDDSQSPERDNGEKSGEVPPDSDDPSSPKQD